MPSRHIRAIIVVAILLTAGCSSLADVDGGAPAFEETELASFETVETICGDIRSDNSSASSRPVAGGRTFSINTTIPVRSTETTLDARLEKLAPHRYQLAIEREGGSGIPTCYLETRYNATLNITDDETDHYTLLVTYDDVLVASYTADPGSSGAAAGLAPETRYAPWARNVSDANGGLSGGADDTESGSDGAGGSVVGSSGGG